MGSDHHSGTTNKHHGKNELIKPLALPQELSPFPEQELHFSIKVKNSQGQEISLADPRATRAALLLMNYHAVMGGAACHWGGPSALAELMSAAHALMKNRGGAKWFEKFHFINDVGHAENGLYALKANYGMGHLTYEKLKEFRSIKSPLTGHGEHHLNKELVFLSNGPLGSSLGQAQGLAFADRLENINRTTLVAISDGACMEGEAKEAFSAIPGLAAKGKLAPFVMIVSDNNTKLSGRIDSDSFSMTPTFDSFSVLGWEVLSLPDGHDPSACLITLEKALELAQKNPLKPVCVWAKTIKGKGLKKTEQSSSGGHGYPFRPGEYLAVKEALSEIYQGASHIPALFSSWAEEISQLKKPSPVPSFNLPGVKKEKAQAGFARAMIAACDQGLPVFSLSSDLAGSTGVAPFHQAYPERSLDVGVAESNMISMAAGLSKLGHLPVVDTFAQFGVTKGALPLTMAALSQASIVAIFSHTGMQDAADGASHQATTYISSLAAIPQTKLIVVSSSEEAQSLMGQALHRLAQAKSKHEESENIIFFVGREDFPVSFSTTPLSYHWGKPQILHRGKDLVLVASGPMVGEALLAAQWLLTQGINATIINHAFINQIDTESFIQEINASGKNLVTLEDHQVSAGMGAILCSKLCAQGAQFRYLPLGIDGGFGRSAYSAFELYHSLRLSGECVGQKIIHWLKQ